ncbi:MAG: hypothetical protein LBJ73_01835 [Rickettsiales bacterium]|nr:hypothetical protein [Rickettsiales bacterium]
MPVTAKNLFNGTKANQREMKRPCPATDGQSKVASRHAFDFDMRCVLVF